MVVTLENPQLTVNPIVDDEPLFEIIDGIRVELPPMSFYAKRVAFRLAYALETYTRSNRIGVVGVEELFQLSSPRERNRRPDVSYVSYTRWPADRPIPLEGNALPIAPDLAVEIVSPTDRFMDILAKVREYLSAGVLQVWLVTPNDETIYIFDSPTQITVLLKTDELDGGTLFPGLRIPVAELFPISTTDH